MNCLLVPYVMIVYDNITHNILVIPIKGGAVDGDVIVLIQSPKLKMCLLWYPLGEIIIFMLSAFYSYITLRMFISVVS